MKVMLNQHADPGSVAGMGAAELAALVARARQLQQAAASPQGVPPLLRGKHIALLCRDRTERDARNFEQLATQLGARLSWIRSNELDWNPAGAALSPAGLLGRLYDAVECQGLNADRCRELERHSGLVVFDGIGRADHPSAVLADLMCLQDLGGGLPFSALRLGCEASPGSPAAAALTAFAQALGVPLEHGPSVPGATAAPAYRVGPDAALPLRWQGVSKATLTPLRLRNRRHLVQALLCRALA